MKMKPLFFMSILMWPILIHGQKNIPLIICNGDVIFEAISNEDSLTAGEIYHRTLNWLGSRMKNAQYVVAVDKPERIVRQFRFTYLFDLSYAVYDHEITFEIKDGKVRIKILIIGLGSVIVKNQNEWRSSYHGLRLIIENSLNELYRTYLLELKINESEW